MASSTSSPKAFDVLNANVVELQAELTAGTLQSADLVNAYLDQIDRHNEKGMKLKALISVVTREKALQRAKELDAERKESGLRGPFHGIPVLVKDTFWTEPSLGMDTTCGSAALRGAKAPKNAAVVDLLLKAGMIILGKANLSELALVKAMPPNTGGWSSAGGQGLSPYVRGGVLANATFLGHSTPGGSSSGSAVGVAAGFAPVSLGHETDGSIVQPAARAGLFALKPSVGTVSMEGVQPVCASFDSIGGIARTAQDLADITALLTGHSDYAQGLDGSWAGKKVGFVDFDSWIPASFVVEPVEEYQKQTREALKTAAQRIEVAGGQVSQNVKLISMQELSATVEEGGLVPDENFSYGFRGSMDKFLGSYLETPVRSLQEMVDYNRAHADICLPADHPSQEALEKALDAKLDPEFDKKLSVTRRRARDSIDTLLKDKDLDVIMGMGDGRIASVASVAGYPVGSFPLGFANFNGRAFGVHAITGRDGEKSLLQLMSAWEKTFPEGRKAPPALVDWKVDEGMDKSSKF